MSDRRSNRKAAGRINSTLRRFLDSESSGGLLLMAVGALAILTANCRPLLEAAYP